MNFSMGDVLHVIGQGLRYPCLAILLLLMLISVWQIGDMLVEFLTERRKQRANVPQLLQQIHGAQDSLEELVANSGLLRQQRVALQTLIAAKGIPRGSMVALAQRLLATEEERCGKVTSITDMAAKLGPMFGLLGTLIPLGPGIVALGQGDTATLATSLGLAFDTTISGLISAAVCVVISNIRHRWYDGDMVSLETIMDCILEEVASNAEK